MIGFLLHQRNTKQIMERMKEEKARDKFLELFSEYVLEKFNLDKDEKCDDLYESAKISILEE